MVNFTETSDLKDLEKYQATADLMKKNVLSATDPLPESFPGRCYYFSLTDRAANIKNRIIPPFCPALHQINTQPDIWYID